jgi:DnaJ-class molecular chaperone
MNSDSRGDLLVTVIVQIPAKLNSRQEELMKEALLGG